MSVLSDMGVRGNGQEILQPMLKNRFRVEFQGLDRGEDLTLQVITTDLPKLSFEEVQLDRYNSRAYVAGKHQFEPINMVFESDIGGTVAKTLKNQLEYQQRLIGMESRSVMPTSRSGGRYKFSAKILQLDGDQEIFDTYYLDGCFIQNIDWGDLDYAASESRKITVTIRFDHMRQDITGIEESAVTGSRAPI